MNRLLKPLTADRASDDVQISQLWKLRNADRFYPVDPARAGPAVKLHRLRLLASRATARWWVAGFWAGTRMQGQFGTSYAVWDVRTG